jgi:hypothetical protein
MGATRFPKSNRRSGWNAVAPENMEMGWIERPSGTRGHVPLQPRVPLRFTLGYFRAFPPGTERIGLIQFSDGNFHGKSFDCGVRS